MSILHRHNCLTTRSATHVPGSLHRDRLRVLCLATTVETKPGPEKLVVQQRAFEPPKLVAAVTAPPVPNDPSLQSTWNHRMWVATGCTTLLVSLVKSVLLSSSTDTWVEPVLAGYVGYVLSDLGSGVYHWGIDNYGGASTPVVGSQIEAFQGHHKWPWTITRRQFANNLHALARVITFTVLPIDLACNDPTWLGFAGLFAGCIMFSQQFHAWAHGTKSKLPPVVVTLQDMGVLVSRSQHAAHHRAPLRQGSGQGPGVSPTPTGLKMLMRLKFLKQHRSNPAKRIRLGLQKGTSRGIFHPGGHHQSSPVPPLTKYQGHQ